MVKSKSHKLEKNHSDSFAMFIAMFIMILQFMTIVLLINNSVRKSTMITHLLTENLNLTMTLEDFNDKVKNLEEQVIELQNQLGECVRACRCPQ